MLVNNQFTLLMAKIEALCGELYASVQEEQQGSVQHYDRSASDDIEARIHVLVKIVTRSKE